MTIWWECFTGKNHTVASLTTLATADADVQFIWSVVSDFEEEDDMFSQHLLTCIVQEILRGHSFRSCYMENYKVMSSAQTKGKKSLRKELKRSASTSKEERSEDDAGEEKKA